MKQRGRFSHAKFEDTRQGMTPQEQSSVISRTFRLHQDEGAEVAKTVLYLSTRALDKTHINCQIFSSLLNFQLMIRDAEGTFDGQETVSKLE